MLVEVLEAHPDSLDQRMFLAHLQPLLEHKPRLLEEILVVLVRTREDLWKSAMMELVKPSLILTNTLEIVTAMARLVQLDQPYLDAYFWQWFQAAKASPSTHSANTRKGIRAIADLSAKGLFNAKRSMDAWVQLAEGLRNGKGAREFEAVLGIPSDPQATESGHSA